MTQVTDNTALFSMTRTAKRENLFKWVGPLAEKRFAIYAKKGTNIKASGSGIITMAEKDLYYTGGTIIIDHGHGISTIYSHLDDINVKLGDIIKRGEVIGTVGSTGRSTGPHLDFRVNWFQTRLDPMMTLLN